MKKIIITIFLLLSFLFSLYSQNTVWKKMRVDENLTISLPEFVSQIDTSFIKDGKEMRFKAFRSEKEFSTLVLLNTPNETKINADNSESLEKALAEMAKGSMKAMSQKGMDCTVSDTLVDNIPCKRLICHSESFARMINYIFLVNDKMYALQTAIIDNNYGSNTGTYDLNHVLKSIHFNKTSIKEQQFDSKAESLGYKVGKMILPLLIIVGVIVYVVRKI